MIKMEEISDLEKPKKGKKQKSIQGTERLVQRKDFMDEILQKLVVIKLTEVGEPIVGKVLDHTPYWLKIEDPSERIIYLNKAHIKTIIPMKQGMNV